MLETLIWLFRHLEHQNPSIISESIGIPNGSEKMGKSEERRNGTERNTESYSYRRGFRIRTPTFQWSIFGNLLI